MSKKVFKYETGAEIPEGATYLSTQVEKKITHEDTFTNVESNFRVWHYFLVDVPLEGTEKGEV